MREKGKKPARLVGVGRGKSGDMDIYVEPIRVGRTWVISGVI